MLLAPQDLAAAGSAAPYHHAHKGSCRGRFCLGRGEQRRQLIGGTSGQEVLVG